MQPWTLASPAMMGQFPATAMIFRNRLVTETPPVVSIGLKKQDVLDLKGTPLPQGANFDELRLADVPGEKAVQPGHSIDPLVHYTGASHVQFTSGPSGVGSMAVSDFIRRDDATVQSLNKELLLNYDQGTLVLESKSAVAVSGDLKKLGKTVFHGFIEMESDMDLGHMLLVSLDSKPLVASQRLLLQVMSEEKNQGWETESKDSGIKQIVDIGKNPWMVKKISGRFSMRHPTSKDVLMTTLDFKGYPKGDAIQISEFELQPDTLYYLIEVKQ